MIVTAVEIVTGLEMVAALGTVAGLAPFVIMLIRWLLPILPLLPGAPLPPSCPLLPSCPLPPSDVLRPILDGGRGEAERGGTAETPLDPFEMMELLERDEEEVEMGADGDPWMERLAMSPGDIGHDMGEGGEKGPFPLFPDWSKEDSRE